MRMYDMIVKKRNGGELADQEIQAIIDGYVGGIIPDYQMSALLMAIYFQGMTNRELGTLTMAMAKSGDMVDLSSIDGIKVDKHSTGGVGDKTTLVLAPLVATCGGKVAKMSGRGLGHTGGTVDKMESIPGMRVEMDEQDFLRQVRKIGVSVIGQSGELAPADKKLYALRDVTGTVESIPLIASSIMSKKLAAGSDAILLDVKVGSGAFMKNIDDAHTLAEVMVRIGQHNGRRMKALLTDMDCPLGVSIGNALEVKEVIETLSGHGPSDLEHECVTMAAHMLELSNLGTYDACLAKAKQALFDGSALRKFQDMIIAQGGNGEVIHDTSLLPGATYTYDIKTTKCGYIQHMQTEEIGLAAVQLGAGRATKEDTIDFGAGIVMAKKTGDAVQVGEILATLYANDEFLFERAADVYVQALTIGADPVELQNPILGMVE